MWEDSLKAFMKIYAGYFGMNELENSADFYYYVSIIRCHRGHTDIFLRIQNGMCAYGIESFLS